MNKGDVITIYVDEKHKKLPIGEFKLIRRMDIGDNPISRESLMPWEYWVAECVETGRKGKYLIWGGVDNERAISR